jgi:hypothetical protein
MTKSVLQKVWSVLQFPLYREQKSVVSNYSKALWEVRREKGKKI